MKKVFTITVLGVLYVGAFVMAQENIGETGTVTLNYNGTSVTYTTVKAADGNVWLQQNLGAARVATAMTDVDSYGDLFQWGRWDDGHQKREDAVLSVTVLNPNNPSSLNKVGENPFYYNGTAANYFWGAGLATDKLVSNVQNVDAVTGCDPCAKLLNGDWRLPTQAEFVSLITAESITNSTTAYNSNLKISLGGVRNANNGTLGSVGSLARFWTSTANASGQAFLATFTNTAASTLNISRGGGISVRCIKKSITTPVEFLGLLGKQYNNSVKLQWQTASEKNNSHFEVLRSSDGKSFQSITTVKGYGDSNQLIDYQYIDNSPVSGTNYYKLKQYDNDGKWEEFTQVLAVNYNLNANKLIASYANGILKLNYQSTGKQSKLTLTDITGKIVLTRKLNVTGNDYEVPVNLQKGVYVVTVEDGSQQISSVKLLN